MSVNTEYHAHVTRTAAVVRERHAATRDAVLSGAFDRFVSALARVTALQLHSEYGNHATVSISDLEHWHGNKRDSITIPNFQAMCSAHGIPQEIVQDFAVSGRDTFDTAFRSVLWEAFGWVNTP